MNHSVNPDRAMTNVPNDEDDDVLDGLATPEEEEKPSVELQLSFLAFQKNAFTKHFLRHLSEEVDRLHDRATETQHSLNETQLRSLLAQTSTLKSIIKYVNTPPVTKS